MANELRVNGYVTGKTLTARLTNKAGQFYYVSGNSWETYGAGGHGASDYDISMTEKGGGAYRGNFPTAMTTPGDYTAHFWDSAISTQAVFAQDLYWDGTQEVSTHDAIGEIGLGQGDHAVTLTIRTTGGVALPAARIWLSTDNDRDNAVTGELVTDDSGQVVFYCDYGTTYYIHGHLAGYRFAVASFTPQSGSVSFTKDIASTFLASGSESDYADSMLVRFLQAARRWTDEPKINKKYSDDWLIARAENNYGLVLAEKNRQLQDPVVARIALSMATGVTDYVIPSTMGPVQSVFHLDSEWQVRFFYERRSSHNELGKGVWVEGNMVRLQTTFHAIGSTIYVDCIPNGAARLHCGTCTINVAGDEVTFGTTPYLGTLDRAINAYAGSVLRIFNVTGTTVTGNYIQERVISSYDVATRKATLAVALDPVPTTDDGYIFYEVAPQIPITFDAILAMKVAWEINAVEGQVKKAAGCQAMYNANLRQLRLEDFARQLQSAGRVDSDTFQNPQYEGAVIYG
jgi:hypothetical protein